MRVLECLINAWAEKSQEKQRKHCFIFEMTIHQYGIQKELSHNIVNRECTSLDDCRVPRAVWIGQNVEKKTN